MCRGLQIHPPMIGAKVPPAPCQLCYATSKMPETVTVPSVLSGHAADIWRAAFLSAYDGTCKDRSEKDACAASVAWAAVKQNYRKNEEGTWVQKAEDAVTENVSPMSQEQYPMPAPGTGGNRSAAWKKAFDDALIGECAKAEDPAACASVVADGAIKEGAEGTVERKFTPLHRNDWGDMSLPVVMRKDYSPEKRAEYAKKGWALPDGSYPIADMGDLMDAISSYGRAPESKRQQVKSHIRERARQLDALAKIGEEWGGKPEKSMSASEVRRSEEAKEDQVLLDEGYGENLAERPDNVESNAWTGRPLEQRTVRALVIERAVARSYEAAAEHAIAEGWQAIPNPTRREEFIFQRWIDSMDGNLLQRAVLVRRARTLDWHMRELTRGAALSLAVQVPPHERRFGDNRI